MKSYTNIFLQVYSCTIHVIATPQCYKNEYGAQNKTEKYKLRFLEFCMRALFVTLLVNICRP